LTIIEGGRHPITNLNKKGFFKLISKSFINGNFIIFSNKPICLDSNSPVSQRDFDFRVATFEFTSQLSKKSSTFLK
jgi:hypothetical protein